MPPAGEGASVRIVVAAAAEARQTSVVRTALEEAGHQVVTDASTAVDVAIALLAPDAPAERLSDVAEILGTCESKGVTSLGAVLGRVADLPDGAEAIPNSFGWLAVGPDATDVTALLRAIDVVCRRTVGDEPDVAQDRGSAPSSGNRWLSSAGRLRARARDVAMAATSAAGAKVRSADVEPTNVEEKPARRGVVFVSYSSRDRRAKDVAAELERLGYTVWVDKSSIKGADDWRVSIERAIRSADAFVLLLSPSVTRNPRYVWVELGLAQSAGKRIVPVHLQRTATLPEGFELVLSGLHRVDLFPDFAAGMSKLDEALGGDNDLQPSGALTARLRRRTGQVRQFAEEHELGRHLRVVAAAAASGAVLTAAALGKSMIEQQERAERALDDERERAGRALDDQREAGERERARALEEYLEHTSRLLRDGMEEVQLTNGISLQDYRDQFRPTFRSIIGEIKGNRPPRADLRLRHEQLVEELRRLLADLDAAAEKADRGDLAGYQRAIERCNKTWSRLVTSTLDWLASVVV